MKHHLRGRGESRKIIGKGYSYLGAVSGVCEGGLNRARRLCLDLGREIQGEEGGASLGTRET